MSPCNAEDLGSIPGSGRSPGEGNTPVFLPGESHGQRSLVGYIPWGCKELDTTERLTLILSFLRFLSGLTRSPSTVAAIAGDILVY